MESKILKNKKGLSLVEMLVAVILLAIVTLVAGDILIAHLRLFTGTSALIDITGTNKIVLDEMVNEVRESVSIVNTCTACGTDTTTSTVLILKIWPLDASSNPYDSGNYDYIVYKRDPADTSKVRKIIYPSASSTRSASNKIISSDISNLNLTYNNVDPAQASDVTIKIKSTVTISNKKQEVEREAKAVLRNK